MKNILLLVVLFSFAALHAQKSERAYPPQIVTKLKIGQEMTLPEHSLKFIKVISDGRCPSDVSCIWEGEIKALIGIYKAQQLVEEKTMVIKGHGKTVIDKNLLFKNEDQQIHGYNIIPYPNSTDQIAAEDYVLELVVN